MVIISGVPIFRIFTVLLKSCDHDRRRLSVVSVYVKKNQIKEALGLVFGCFYAQLDILIKNVLWKYQTKVHA